jgi:trimeric autotransporter adhesin
MAWHRRRWVAAVAGLAVAVTATLAAAPLQPSAGATPVPQTWVPDGSSQERAAASCWEIKQSSPSAPDGVYWLVTPRLVTPEQFYCDMTTDGGGWVLIGRGRDGWSETGDAMGTPAQVRTDVWDTAGFKPKKLSDDDVNGLLNGGAPKDLPDGVRIVRAANSAGTTTTDLRFHLTKMPAWSWAFSGGQPGNATAYSASSTRNTAGRSSTTINATTTRLSSSNPLASLETYVVATNNWVAGWNYGQTTLGQNSATSFLYSTQAQGQWATPMTQIWIRPRLTTASVSYPQTPDDGAPAITQPPLAQSGAIPSTWGVTGLANGNTNELNTEAHAFAQIGNVMYVGGNFARVEQHADRKPGGPATQSIQQSYLAAFDARTGDWIPGFRPVLNNQVNALVALPDGELAVGGQFTTVNGQQQAGLVALDPTTGATVDDWKIKVEDRIAGESVNVQAMDLQGGWLYLGGNFTHLTGGSSPYAVYARKAARVQASDATPDKDWNPAFDGKVQAIDASADGQRVYVSGYFTKSGNTPAMRAAIISAAPGAAVVPFTPLYSVASSPYQQAIHEAGSTFWIGGSEHSMFGYDTASLAPKSLNITRNGGDIQAITDNDDQVVYGACHCGDWVFTGQQDYAMTVGSPTPTWQEAHRIDYVGAWDARTGAYLPAFVPTSKARGGYGAWALDVASDGTLWAGGSYISAIAQDGRNQWAGGFVRFAVRPHTAPAAPSAPSATLSGSVATLTWQPSSTSGVTYEVLRGGRVVGTTQQTSIQIPDSTSSDRFFVRASDGAGDRSATTGVAPLSVEPTTVVLVPANATWRYHADAATAPAADWSSADFDDSGWSSGAAPLGWGDTSIVTNVDPANGQQRPITAYYRDGFDVTDPSSLTDLQVTTRADDGIVVYLNGHEIARKNMPATGAVGPNTYATAAPRTSAATADPLVVPLDRSQLVAGRNVVAVEVHSNYRATPNTSMALTLTGHSD